MIAQPQAAVRQSTSSALDWMLARFRLLGRRRAAWLRHVWEQEGEPAGAAAVTHGEVAAILADHDSPEAETRWISAQSWASQWSADLREVEDALAHDTSSRLARLKQTFGLSEDESDLLEACAAVALDPALSRVCAYLQDRVARSYMTEDLAAALYGYGRCSVWTRESGLYRWELISSCDSGPGEPRALACDPLIRNWLRGGNELHEALAGIAQPCPSRTPIASWPLAETSQWIRRLIESETPARVRVTVQGARGSGRRTFAAAVSAELGLTLLALDADQVDDAQWRRVYRLAQRQAYLDRRALAWHGESLTQRPWPAAIQPFPLQFVIVEPAREATPCPDLVERKVRMPGLSVAERSELWRHHLPGAQVWPEAGFRQLTERYRVHIGDIASVASSGAAGPEEAGLRVREASRGRLGNLAQFLHCPFHWDDLVVPEQVREALEDIVFEANHRVAFWEQSEPRRLFPQGQGLMALFSGPPGTGKTMAAQVTAASLGYDLFRVDLAGVVSKWVGETSQNLERILTRAADMHAMLLFDECDALFGKRSSEIRDAQDRFANTDAAYLLQAIESYPGVALLATNQKGNIDPAFIRRLRYVLEFAKPDLAQRLEIWRKVVRALAGEDRMRALDPALRSLSEAIDTTGAQIKFGILGAMFGAKREGVPLELRHLLRGLERELAKEGRMLGARERERILSHAR